MDFMTELGALAIASRLRRLSDVYWQGVTTIYRESGIDFEVKWATVFLLIARRGPVSVMELADQLGVTHPAVIQIVNELVKHDLIMSEKSEQDSRRRMLTLSAAGEAMMPKMQPLWDAIQVVNQEMIEQQPHNLLLAIQAIEDALSAQSFASRIQQYVNQNPAPSGPRRKTAMNELSIIPYTPQYQPDFQRLNVAWISAMFVVEPHDLEQLEHPEAHILPNGGAIFLAKLNDDIVGTVAMVNTTEGNGPPESYELAKMSVAPAVQGRGAGQLLAEAAIEYARQMGAKMVWLESNRKAEAAIRLYHRVGFREVPLRPSLYTRADICMELEF